MDAMNPDDPFFDQKIADLQRHYDFQYERMAEITEELDAANDQDDDDRRDVDAAQRRDDPAKRGQHRPDDTI